MLETRKRCRVCGSPHTVFAFALGLYRIVKCRRCRFAWPEPLPSEDEIIQFYRDCHHPTAVGDTINFPERESVIRTIRRLCLAGAKILDVGCGFGHYLDIAKRYGFRTFGVEPDAGRAAEAQKKGHSVYIGTLSPSAFEGIRFDVVILNHVVEHLLNPQEVVSQIREHLKENGILYIATPNFGGAICTVEGSHHTHFTPPEHISYFTRASLVRLLTRCGFRLIRERRFTHHLHTYDLLAHLLKFKFLKKAKYRNPWAEKSTVAVPEGRFRNIRSVRYALALAASRVIAPAINVIGGEHLQMFSRSGSAM
jgi:2-polyprenyl-3-methyl-5-hydroxy-6-metoxy-1,4-benzoquinol methylase